MSDSIFTSSWMDPPARSQAAGAVVAGKRTSELAGLGERSFLDPGRKRSKPSAPRPVVSIGSKDADDLAPHERETRLGALVGALSDRQCRRLVLAHALGHAPLMEDIEDALEAWSEEDEDEDEDSPRDSEPSQQRSPVPRPRRPSRPGFPSQDPRHSPTVPRRKANRLLYTDRQVMVSHDAALAEAPALEFELYVERLELKLYAHRHRPSQTGDRSAKKRADADRHCARDVIDSCNAGLRAIRDSVSYDAVSPPTLLNACQAVLEMTLVLLGTPDPVQELVTGKYKHPDSKWVHYWPDLSFEEYFALLSNDEKDVLLSRVLWRTGRTVNQELRDLVQRCLKEGMMPGFEDAVGTLLPKTLDQRPGASPDPFRETEAVSFKPAVHRISRDHDRERQVRGDRAPLIHAVPVAFRAAQTARRIAFDAREGSSLETRNNALVALCDLVSIVLRDPLTRFGDEIRRHFLTEGEALVAAFQSVVDGLKPPERAAVLDQAYASLRGTVLEPTVEDALEEYVQDAKFHGLFKGLDACLAALRSKDTSTTS